MCVFVKRMCTLLYNLILAINHDNESHVLNNENK